MKEIKFRAWDNRRNCMCKVQQILFDNYNKPKVLLVPYGQFNAYWERDVILMQYIGIKDKNGREIYEGDIVTMTDEFRGIFMLGIVHWDEKNCAFVLSESYSSHLLNEAVEVLGNIYENPELLKGVDADE